MQPVPKYRLMFWNLSTLWQEALYSYQLAYHPGYLYLLVYILICLTLVLVVESCWLLCSLSSRCSWFYGLPQSSVSLIYSTMRTLSLLYQTLYENISIIVQSSVSSPSLPYIPQSKGKGYYIVLKAWASHKSIGW